MTSEQAKDRLNYLLEDKCECPQCQLDKEAYRVILNLIEKLQKERDIYYYEWKTLEADLINKNLMPKDKIRKNLKHCEEELEKINNGEEFEDERDFYDYAIIIYKDLLEESE